MFSHINFGDSLWVCKQYINFAIHNIDTDECTGGLCGNNATCINIPGSYICSCNTGYQGDGSICNGK